MNKFIAWIIEQIENGTGTATLLTQLKLLQRIGEKCPSYYLDSVVGALTEVDEDAE